MCRCRIYLDSETPAPKVNCRASWFCIQTQLPGIINSMHPLPRGFVCFLAYAFNTYIKQNLLPNSKSAYWFYHHLSSEIWANFLSLCPEEKRHISHFSRWDQSGSCSPTCCFINWQGQVSMEGPGFFQLANPIQKSWIKSKFKPTVIFISRGII